MSFHTETIDSVLNRINKEESPDGLFLPHIQRDFVWAEENVCRLLDSLMRGYPIGTILTWETDSEIAYRKFIKTHYPTAAHNFDADIKTAPQGTRRTYVLDGQQRLQSLYIARDGNYGKSKELYFDLLSNEKSDDGYCFQFLPFVKNSGPLKLAKEKSSTWINVRDFLNLTFDDYKKGIPETLEKNNIIIASNIEGMKTRIKENAIRLYKVFKTEKVITRQALTDKNVSLNDVVEVFVRANAGGVVLEKADLLMALLRGRWPDVDRQFEQIYSAITKLGYTRMKDFVLRACFAMIGKGASFRANTFAASPVQKEIKEKINDLSEAIHDVLKFVADFKFLSIQNAAAKDPLLLAVCYRYHHPQSWENAIKDETIKKFLFAAFLSKAFDKTPPTMMLNLLQYVKTHDTLRIQEIENIISDPQHRRTLKVKVDDLLKLSLNSPKSDIVLQLFYKVRAEQNDKLRKLYDPNQNTDHDHIFPLAMFQDSEVVALGYTADEQDSVLNCEMLTPEQNRQRQATPPGQYFPMQKPEFLLLHGIPNGQDKKERHLLDIRHFRDFLAWRKDIFEKSLNYAFTFWLWSGTPPNRGLTSK